MERENTRVKDLVDLVVLIERGVLDVPTLRRGLDVTFEARQRQSLPIELPEPPSVWAQDYRVLSTEAGVSVGEVGAAFDLLRGYWSLLDLGRGH